MLGVKRIRLQAHDMLIARDKLRRLLLSNVVGLVGAVASVCVFAVLHYAYLWACGIVELRVPETPWLLISVVSVVGGTVTFILSLLCGHMEVSTRTKERAIGALGGTAISVAAILGIDALTGARHGTHSLRVALIFAVVPLIALLSGWLFPMLKQIKGARTH